MNKELKIGQRIEVYIVLPKAERSYFTPGTFRPALPKARETIAEVLDNDGDYFSLCLNDNPDYGKQARHVMTAIIKSVK